VVLPARAVVERAAASLTQPNLSVVTAEVLRLDVAGRRLHTSAGPVPFHALCVCFLG
jgi:hypothetical protein